MRKMCLAVVFAVMILFMACTQQERAKEFGGSATMLLPHGEKLIHVTWKEDQLWYLTRPMKPGEQPETYTFLENSSYGILQGRVTISEQP